MWYIFTKSSKYRTLFINILLFMHLQRKHIKVIFVIIIYVVQPLLILSFIFVQLEHYEDGHLVHKLNDFWPNLIINKPNYNYWKQEFEKHGSCFFPTQEQYFESTAWMVDQIPGLTPKLESEGQYTIVLYYIETLSITFCNFYH